MKFILVTQEICPRCDRAKKLLRELQKELPFVLVEDEDEDYTEEHVVFMGELPRKWRLKEIIGEYLERYAGPEREAV